MSACYEGIAGREMLGGRKLLYARTWLVRQGLPTVEGYEHP